MIRFEKYFRDELLRDLRQMRNNILFSSFINVNDGVIVSTDPKLKELIIDYLDNKIKGVIKDEV